MLKFFLSLAMSLLCFLQPSFAQFGINITESPNYLVPCDTTCVMLHANFPKQLKTNQYAISTTPFTPIMLINPVSVALQDDKFSGAIPLGFDFCFFENMYSTCYVSDNGILTFNALYANSSCFNNTQQLLPYYNSTCPDNAIFGLFMDLAPSQGGTIQYATSGVAPFRKFVISYQGLKLFGSMCSSVTNSFQIVLNETTNIIEVLINNKAVCNTNNALSTNYASVGVQNSGATNAYMAAGKHGSIFTTTNEGVRIAPSGALNYSMNWKASSGQTLASNVDSFYFCPPYYPYNKLTASVVYYCPAGNFSDTISFKKNAPVIQSCVVVKPICANSLGSIDVLGSGVSPFIYSINNGVYGSNHLFNNLQQGNYFVSIKDANGCKKDTTIALVPQFILSVIIDTIVKPTCPLNNGSIQVHGAGGTAPYSYLWGNGISGSLISNIGAGTYQVVVTDANGCSTSAYILVMNKGLPDVVATKVQPICGQANGSVSLAVTGGTPSYAYSWSPGGGTTSSINNKAAGFYSVVVTDAIGCSTSKIYQLIDTLYILNSKTIQTTTCGLGNGSADIAPFNSIAPYTYGWIPTGQSTSQATNLSSGWHKVIITAANGCTKIDSMFVPASTPIVNQITFANANCELDNGIINLNAVTNALSPVTSWSTGTIGVNALSGLAQGVYWVKSIDNIGCYDIDTIVILNDGRPKLNIVTYFAPKCYGDNTGSVLLSGSSGVAPYKYSLDGINFSSVAKLDSIPGGTYPIYITDANSCPNDTLVTFSQPNEIKLSIESDTVICFSDTNAQIQFTVIGGISPILFSINQGNYNTQQNYQNLAAGQYTITAKDGNDCLSTDVVDVVAPAEPLRVLVKKKDIPCFENATGAFDIELQGGWPPYNYNWSTSTFTGLSYQQLGVTHELISVIDVRGCSQNAKVDIEQLYCCKAVVPSAFSPNGDKQNNELRILPISDISSVDFKVYNRYGQVVFATKDIDIRWDGMFKNQSCDMGTYYYWLTYNCPFAAKRVEQKGDIQLIR
jgi:gliding motility-associated-like protein